MRVSRFAPFIFVLLWSTGFVGAKYGLPFADPFIFLALRLFIAALILFGIAVLLKSPIALTRIQIRSSALIGIFLHAAYLGGVFFAISKGVTAGTAAVITSLQPVLVSLLAIKVLNEKLHSRQILGLILGLCGVVLVLGPSFESSVSQLGILAVFIALIGSTTATLLQKKIGSGIPLLAGTAYQYCASGFFLFIVAVVTGGTEIQWNIRFASAMIWLILVLSVGAILLLLWLLNTASTASVSSLFYLVPPATAVEAYFLFGEKLNTQSLLGIAITALGVWLVLRSGN
ncbi:MAG: DMT family transporter [Candidatus Planktophila sp.]|nr:DMT family transporter [Candidatus Planktophila sp.]